MAEWVCSGGLVSYRNYHLQHHKYAQQSEDPDLALSAPFPITRASMRRKIVRDLTGQTWFKQRFGRLTAKLKARKNGEPIPPIFGAEIVRQRRWLIGNALGALALSLACWLIGRAFGAVARTPLSYAWVWFATVAACRGPPGSNWSPRLRNIAEHAAGGPRTS